MPVDDTLPPSRLSPLPGLAPLLDYFPDAFGIRVDTAGLDALPARERLRLAGARPPEPPEAVLLDRVLQLVPWPLLRHVERIVVLPTRGVGRYGGYRHGIVRLSASEAEVQRGDPIYGNRFSLFTTTIAHELGHAIYETALTPEQRDAVLGSFLRSPSAPKGDDELSETRVEHHFVDLFVPALLGYGTPPYTAAVSRRALAGFGLDLRRS